MVETCLIVLDEQKVIKKGKKKGMYTHEGEAAMAAATWEMITDPPLTFASERRVVVRESNTCERGGIISERTRVEGKKRKRKKT
jgi:hypothetical protein